MYRMMESIFKDPFSAAVIGFIYSTLISTLIAYFFYKISGRDLKNFENRLNEKNELKYFEELLESGSWKKNLINESIYWVSDKDHTCQIEIINDEINYNHPWALRNPSKSAMVCTVYLTHNSLKIKKLRFLSIDDGRLFVPKPERKPSNNEYFLKRDSIEFKISKIIGRYYIYDNLEIFAQKHNICLK